MRASQHINAGIVFVFASVVLMRVYWSVGALVPACECMFLCFPNRCSHVCASVRHVWPWGRKWKHLWSCDECRCPRAEKRSGTHCTVATLLPSLLASGEDESGVTPPGIKCFSLIQNPESQCWRIPVLVCVCVCKKRWNYFWNKEKQKKKKVQGKYLALYLASTKYVEKRNLADPNPVMTQLYPTYLIYLKELFHPN